MAYHKPRNPIRFVSLTSFKPVKDKKKSILNKYLSPIFFTDVSLNSTELNSVQFSNTHFAR